MLAEPDIGLEALHRLFHGRILNYIRRRIASEETAQELAADVFRIAWQKAASVPEPSIGWLLAVARNLIGNEYRGRQRIQQLQARLAETERTNSQFNDDGERDGVEAALNLLREKDREILFLAYWEDLSLREIATVFSCTESAAGVRLYRARKAFERALPKHLKTESEH